MNLPFMIGDVDPDGPFVHVFDRPAIERLLRMLDTITDFAIYLHRRAQAIRDERIVMGSGEDDLIAYYMSHVGADGEHDFVHPQMREWRPGARLIIEPGYFREFVKKPEFLRKIEADEVSYIWDKLITRFSDNVLAGTLVSVRNLKPTPASAERALRTMARERRVHRRLLGDKVRTSYEEMIRQNRPRFTRIMVPSAGSMHNRWAYIFMILAYPDDVPLENGYQQYREVRVWMLEAYCLALLSKHRDLEMVVGIGVDAPSDMTGRKGGSEDLVAIGRQEWTPELLAEVEERREKYNILEHYSGEVTRFEVEEYPAPPPDHPQPMTRQRRRAQERARAKEIRRGLRIKAQNARS